MTSVINKLDELINCVTKSYNSYPQNITDDEKNDKIINKVAIVYAMEEEAKPLIDRLNLSENGSYSQLLSPFTIYSNDQNTIFVSCNGKCPIFNCDRIGTQWAAMCALSVLKHIEPDLIINAGTSGGIVPKYAFGIFEQNEYNEANYKLWPTIEIGDVFIGTNVIYSDRRVPIPQWKNWDIGNYDLFASQHLSNKLNIPTATIATSNAFDYTKHDRELYKKHTVICKEMECAAIAEICSQFNTKLIAIKGVTDIVEHHDGEHFLANLEKTVSNVTDNAEKVINYVIGKSITMFENIKT